uniref:Uncharacterized protein n=1 Tax=Rhizophora mucronata TaxID=61149 RepID=A0A2P2QUP1_RHIMU
MRVKKRVAMAMPTRTNRRRCSRRI